MSAGPISTYVCETDFYAFWSAAQQFFAGRNPYLLSEYPALLHGGQCGAVFPYAVMNPPWGLPLLFPFIPGDLVYAFFVYLSLNLLSLILIFRCVSDLESSGERASRPLIAWAPLVTFGPIFVALVIGQITIFIALFFSVFLALFKRRRYFASGIVLSLTLMKPHLLYLVYFFIGLKALRAPAFRLTLLGVAAGGAALSLTAIGFMPDVFVQYQIALETKYQSDWVTPTLGSVIRYMSPDITRGWIVPVLAGITLTLLELRRTRENQIEQLLNISLLSLLTTPYLWSYDFTLLLPAAAAIIFSARRGAGLGPFEIAGAALIFICNIALLAHPFYHLCDVLYLWVLLLLWLMHIRAGRVSVAALSGA